MPCGLWVLHLKLEPKHLAGRRVAVDAAVAGDLFAAGYSVIVMAPTGGDASVTGYEVTLGPVAGMLLAIAIAVFLKPGPRPSHGILHE